MRKTRLQEFGGYNPHHYSVTGSVILQNQNNIAATKQQPLCKRILIIDDHFDTTLTFKAALETCNNNNIEFEVYTCNDPLAALLEFKPNFYDLLLIDINLPYMNGFELSEKILKLDLNVKGLLYVSWRSKSWSNKRDTSVFEHRVFYTKASYH
jgi:PleD family two-component response regulator